MLLSFDSMPDAVALGVIDRGISEDSEKTIGFRRDVSSFVLRDEQGGCQGGVKTYTVGPDFFVSWLWVSQDFRGQGWGRQLMEQAENLARALGCSQIWVDTMSFQAPAFYESLGFVRVSVIKDYYRGHDRISLNKPLRSGS